MEPLTAALTLLNSLPAIMTTVASIRENLSTEDQATLDAAIDKAKAEALAATDQAISDLDDAAKRP